MLKTYSDWGVASNSLLTPPPPVVREVSPVPTVAEDGSDSAREETVHDTKVSARPYCPPRTNESVGGEPMGRRWTGSSLRSSTGTG